MGTGIPPRTISNAPLNHHRANLESLDLLHDDGLTVGGAAAHRIDFRGVPQDAPALRVTELLWSKDGVGCLLNMIASEEMHDRWGAAIDQIAESFEFRGKERESPHGVPIAACPGASSLETPPVTGPAGRRSVASSRRSRGVATR